MHRIPYALMAVILTSCATTGDLTLPPIPSDIKATLERTVPKPKAGPMTKAQVVALIAKLHASDVGKTAAGKRLIALYEARLPK